MYIKSVEFIDTDTGRLRGSLTTLVPYIKVQFDGPQSTKPLIEDLIMTLENRYPNTRSHSHEPYQRHPEWTCEFLPHQPISYLLGGEEIGPELIKEQSTDSTCDMFKIRRKDGISSIVRVLAGTLAEGIFTAHRDKKAKTPVGAKVNEIEAEVVLINSFDIDFLRGYANRLLRYIKQR